MSQFWSPWFHSLTPYVPGKQPELANLIKLNTNENPYPPSPHAVAAMHAEIGAAESRFASTPRSERRSPEGSGRPTFADFGIRSRTSSSATVQDEVLAHAFMALSTTSRSFCRTLPTASTLCIAAVCRYRQHRHSARRAVRDPRERLARDNSGIHLLANPNAPTGRIAPLSEVERLVAAHPQSVVVIDEAYIDLAAESPLHWSHVTRICWLSVRCCIASLPTCLT